MRIRDLYDDLLRTGDLEDLFDGMTGIWEEDKIKFRQQQESLESFSNNLETYIDDSE